MLAAFLDIPENVSAGMRRVKTSKKKTARASAKKAPKPNESATVTMHARFVPAEAPPSPRAANDMDGACFLDDAAEPAPEEWWHAEDVTEVPDIADADDDTPSYVTEEDDDTASNASSSFSARGFFAPASKKLAIVIDDDDDDAVFSGPGAIFDVDDEEFSEKCEPEERPPKFLKARKSPLSQSPAQYRGPPLSLDDDHDIF